MPNRYTIVVSVNEVDGNGKTQQPATISISSTYATADEAMALRLWSKFTEQVDEYFCTTQFMLGSDLISTRVPFDQEGDPDND